MYFEENTNRAVLTKPCLPAMFRDDKAEYDAVMGTATPPAGRAAPYGGLYLVAAHDRARANAGRKKEKTISLDIVFPATWQLSQRAWTASSGADGELTLAVGKLLTYEKNTGKRKNPPPGAGAGVLGDPIVTLYSRMIWQFVNLSSVERLGEPTNTGEALVDDAFAGM